MSDTQVLVVGAGISGLATAWWLSRLGMDVELWEAGTCAGGKIRTRTDEGFISEDAAALLMRFRPEVDELVNGLGLAGEKQRRSPDSSRYVVKDGRLMAVPTRLGALVASPLWSFAGKMRLLAEPFAGRGCRIDESVSEFITRRLGREMLDFAMEPYLSGPLASDPDLAEARSVLPRLTGLERDYGSLTAGVLTRRLTKHRTVSVAEGFSFRNGMSALVDALATSLGPRLRLGRRVKAIEPDKSQWSVTARTQNGIKTVTARHVVLCCPANVSSEALKSVDRELAALLGDIDYAPVSVVHLGFDSGAISHSLDGTGFLVPRTEGEALTGCLWTSSMFDGRAPSDQVLLTCYLGGSRRPEVLEWDDQRTVSAALEPLRRLLGIRCDPGFTRIHRHRRALPLYHNAYQARLEAVDARLHLLSGLHVEGNYRGGVSVQDRIACGASIAARIAEDTVRMRIPSPRAPRVQVARAATASGISSRT